MRTTEQKANLERWAQNLESGKYPQGTSKLVKKDDEGNDCYCVMGTACLEMGLDPSKYGPWYPPYWAMLNHFGIDDTGYFGHKERLPFTSLMDLNDKGYTFPQLAQVIREVFINNQ